MKAVPGLFLTILLSINLLSVPAGAEEDRTGLYLPGDYRIAAPGGRPLTNFYSLSGFRRVDPSCYAGILTWEVESTIPLGGGAKFYENERINVRPARNSERFPHRFRWEIYSDPLEIMGVVSTSEGSGAGTARVWLSLDIEHGVYRLVTDVRPRADNYVISTTGAGAGRSVNEDFNFGFGDHHYSYVDLSALQAASAAPEVQAALDGIGALLSNRPPNVYMGYFDWGRDDDGTSQGELLIEDEDGIAFGWGAKGQGQRHIHIRIFCSDVIRRYEARWGSD